jgi:hypothetical protein
MSAIDILARLAKIDPGLGIEETLVDTARLQAVHPSYLQLAPRTPPPSPRVDEPRMTWLVKVTPKKIPRGSPVRSKRANLGQILDQLSYLRR